MTFTNNSNLGILPIKVHSSLRNRPYKLINVEIYFNKYNSLCNFFSAENLKLLFTAWRMSPTQSVNDHFRIEMFFFVIPKCIFPCHENETNFKLKIEANCIRDPLVMFLQYSPRTTTQMTCHLSRFTEVGLPHKKYTLLLWLKKKAVYRPNNYIK